MGGTTLIRCESDQKHESTSGNEGAILSLAAMGGTTLIRCESDQKHKSTSAVTSTTYGDEISDLVVKSPSKITALSPGMRRELTNTESVTKYFCDHKPE
ncbi:hypothetical protein J6590_068769 [Homalodisca vitripennis]|nr:hypothetical protein J6590_068767 [Homalodisca vitripennis]KAG8242309.1 hypothetical protein J6590_068769 [Homalodisca vitripennis]